MQNQLKDSGGNAIANEQLPVVIALPDKPKESPPETSPAKTTDGDASRESTVSPIPGAGTPPVPGSEEKAEG